MNNYELFYKKKAPNGQEPPHGDYTLTLSADSLESAAISGALELWREGFMDDVKEVCDARIIDVRYPEKPYTILRDGVWLINLRTGKLIEPDGKR